MQEPLFVDTGAWVGRFATKDQYHARAAGTFALLEREKRPLVTTDYILSETVTLLRKQAGLNVAAQVWEQLDEGSLARVVQINPEHRRKARRLFVQYDKINLSLVDGVSFAVMRDMEIHEAFTFDDDFRKVGFLTLPRP